MEAKKVVEYALSQIGTAEDPLGSNKQKYGALIDSTDWYLYKDGERTWRHLVNGYDWCTQFVDASFITTYTIDMARKMLFRPTYNNLGAVVKYAFNYFKAAGHGYTKEEYNPKPGDVIYFQNSAGLSHTGIVVEVTDSQVITVEGNAGKNCWYVAKGTYSKKSSYIYGYGHPNYDEPEPEPPHKDGWEKTDGKWYYYKDGQMVKSDWIKYKGDLYYLGADGAMLTGWQTIGEEEYYFHSNGAMAREEWIDGLYLDQDGCQRYRQKGSWKSNSKGKWWEDESGWYPKDRTVRIDCIEYKFNKDGYLID